MIYSIDDLKIKFSNYAKLYDKVRHEVQAGRLIPIVRELYETDSTIDGKYLAFSDLLIYHSIMLFIFIH